LTNLQLELRVVLGSALLSGLRDVAKLNVETFFNSLEFVRDDETGHAE
jgi:hypothetical protein